MHRTIFKISMTTVQIFFLLFLVTFICHMFFEVFVTLFRLYFSIMLFDWLGFS